jgi:hypothetical protein
VKPKVFSSSKKSLDFRILEKLHKNQSRIYHAGERSDFNLMLFGLANIENRVRGVIPGWRTSHSAVITT